MLRNVLEAWLVSDHPVCRSKVGFADFLLMRQPRLLTRRGLRRRKYCVPIHSHQRPAPIERRASSSFISAVPRETAHHVGPPPAESSVARPKDGHSILGVCPCGCRGTERPPVHR